MSEDAPLTVILRDDHADNAPNAHGGRLPHLVHPCVPDSPIPPANSPTPAQVLITVASPAHTPLQLRSPVSPRPQQPSPRAQYARPHPPATNDKADVPALKHGKAVQDCPAAPPASPRVPHVRFSSGECVAAQAGNIISTACAPVSSAREHVNRVSPQHCHIDPSFPSFPSSNSVRALPLSPRSLSNPVPPATTPCTNPSSSVSLTANNSPVPPPSTPCNGIPPPIVPPAEQEPRFRFLLGHKMNTVPVPPPTTPRGEHASAHSIESLPYLSSSNANGTVAGRDVGLMPELLARLPDIVTRKSSGDLGYDEYPESLNGDGLSSPSVVYPGSPSLQDAASSCSPRSTLRGSPHRARKGSRSSSPTSPCVKLMNSGFSFRETLLKGNYVMDAESPTRHNRTSHGTVGGSPQSKSSRAKYSSQSRSVPLDNSPSIESELSARTRCSGELEVSKYDPGFAGFLPDVGKAYGCVGSYGRAGFRDSVNRRFSPPINDDQEQASETVTEEQEKAVATIQRAYRRRVVRSWVRITVQGCGGYIKWTFGERGATVSNFTINRSLLSDPSGASLIMKGDRLYKINNIHVFNMPKVALKAVWKEERGAGSRTLLCVVRPRA